MPLTAEQRAAAVGFLTANCDCWKGHEATLNEMADGLLARLRATAETHANNALVANAVKAALGGDAPASPEGIAAVVNEKLCDPAGGKKKPAADDDYTDPADVAANRRTAADSNPANKGTPMGMTEALEKYGTPEDRAVWNAAKRVEKREKLEIVRRLVANISDPDRRKARGNALMREPLGRLEDMLELIPAANGRQAAADAAPRFDGAADFGFSDAPAANDRDGVLANAEVLGTDATDWAALAAETE